MTTTHKLINQLIQLQELVVANMQKKISMPKAQLGELEKSIKALGSDLPADIKTHFNRLLTKSPEAIVPVAGSNCTGCGMGLTKSLVNTVHKAEQMCRCPNCTRYLYYPEQLIEGAPAVDKIIADGKTLFSPLTARYSSARSRPAASPSTPRSKTFT